MPEFSGQSKGRLLTCTQRLQDLFNEVVKHWDCTIVEGHRDQKRQYALYQRGRSRTLNSKHLRWPSLAVDAAPYPIDWDDTNRFYAFGGFVLGVASQMDIPIRWGGDWDSDRQVKDQSFNDLAHFEIRET